MLALLQRERLQLAAHLQICSRQLIIAASSLNICLGSAGLHGLFQIVGIKSETQWRKQSGGCYKENY